MTRILVTGSTGLIGSEVVRHAVEGGHEVAQLRRGGPAPCDLTDGDAVRALVAATRTEVIVHAGAWTDVDGCELDPDRALAVNVGGTEHVVAAAADVGAHVVLISTDLVFDGTKATPYVETDEPDPISVYGRTKLLAEHAVGGSHTIVRTSWVNGGPPDQPVDDMVRTVLRLAATGRPMHFVDDQIGRPTFTADLVPALVALGLDRAGGTWHVTNQGSCSWFEFARATLEAAGLDPGQVRPIATADLRPVRPARRPANSVLDDAALRAAGRDRLGPFGPSLHDLVRSLTT